VRLWSLHPKYLDARGLVALWREALLAQAVLAGRTKGYVHHPQLERFRMGPPSTGYIADYLRAVSAEAVARGYRFDAAKIDAAGSHATRATTPLRVTRGQLDFEWSHLRYKLESRDPELLKRLTRSVRMVEPHPLFQVRPGGIAAWERP
jgi:hypothetical protein